jgi:hypothetical protein
MSLFLAPASSYPDVVGRPVTAAGLDMSSLGLSRVVAPYSLFLRWIRRSLWFELVVVLGIVTEPCHGRRGGVGGG